MSVQTSYGTTRTKAIEGALADNGPHDVVVKYNGEASAEIAFGRGVKFGATDDAALLPSAQADKICGITVHSDQYAAEELGTTGMKPKAVMSVLRKGRIWAMARSAVTPGDRLFIRAVSSESGFEKYGGLEDAADASDMIDSTAQGVWLDTAAQGELARLEVDFTNKP
jgi:hypothetical protein